MENDINKNVCMAIKMLMEKSFWGKYSDIDSLIKDLMNESEEFIQGCKNKDVLNSKEEAADIIMIILCILYKMSNNEHEMVDDIMKQIIFKLERRFFYLFDKEQNLEPDIEEEAWQQAKKIENITNYMFCCNTNCDFYNIVGEGNINYNDGHFYCSNCGNKISVSKKTVFFYNRKNRKKYIDTIAKFIIAFANGNDSAHLIFKIDYSKICNAFYKDILKKENNIADSFIDYICKSYQLERNVVKEFCDEVIQDYSCENIRLPKEEKLYREVTTNMGNIYFDVIKKVEKTVNFNARNWNNQLVHKYLLDYSADNISRIIECMTIIHFQDEKIRDLTIELSNMYNCIVGCRFCASASLPEATLYLEPIDYVRQLNTCLKNSGITPSDFDNFYVSFAGIGEPSVVYKNIAEGMKLICQLYPKVKFNIATFGFDINCFDYWANCKLPIRVIQVPFYSCDIERLRYIVKNLPKDYSFKNILEKAIAMGKKINGCNVKVNYIVMKNINDSVQDIEEMSELLKNYKSDVVIKISYLNFTKSGEENNIISPGCERLKEIKELLDNNGYNTYIFGTDINTELGCGQLVQNHISRKMTE